MYVSQYFLTIMKTNFVQLFSTNFIRQNPNSNIYIRQRKLFPVVFVYSSFCRSPCQSQVNIVLQVSTMIYTHWFFTRCSPTCHSYKEYERFSMNYCLLNAFVIQLEVISVVRAEKHSIVLHKRSEALQNRNKSI